MYAHSCTDTVRSRTATHAARLFRDLRGVGNREGAGQGEGESAGAHLGQRFSGVVVAVL